MMKRIFSGPFAAACLVGLTAALSTLSVHSQTPRQAQFAQLDYDVVYVRCPRGKEPVRMPDGNEYGNWNGVNDIWLSASNNLYQQPGCDLVLHRHDKPHGDPAAEQVLIECDEDVASGPVCSVADPNVSFDGSRIVYTKFEDTRSFITDRGFNGNGGWGETDHLQSVMELYPDGDGPLGKYAHRRGILLEAFDAPAHVYIYDLKTGTERRVSPPGGKFAGRAHPGLDPEWESPIPVMDTGPFFLPDGRIGFTSNRASGFYQFQLFAMDVNGDNLEWLGHRAMGQQLHPAMLSNGKVVYTSQDTMLQRSNNNDYSLFTINPDGSDPFIFAGKTDATHFSYHYVTQLSDGDAVVTLYYDNNNGGMGSLQRFPADPAGPDFEHHNYDPGVWKSGNQLHPFARRGEYRLTPEAPAGDQAADPYVDSGDYWRHPVDGRTVMMNGKFTHPSGAPDNGLLTTYTIGSSSTMGKYYVSLQDTLAQIGKDAGIWLFPLAPNGTDPIGHVAEDGLLVVDHPDYHEIMPRAVVPYSRIHGKPQPDAVARNDNLGLEDPRLPAGAPWGLTGASSLYDRETRALNGTPWNAKDGGGFHSGRTYQNLLVQGGELAIFDNEEIAGIRVSLPIPQTPNGFSGSREQWAGKAQNHHLRILGEFPVRKPGVTDGQGNPDTSFIVRIPADTPFLFQTIDKHGMALDIETTSRTVGRGEQQLCVGCHVHTRDGLDPEQSFAKLDTGAPFGDFTRHSAPLFAGVDAQGRVQVAAAEAVYPELPGISARRSLGVDWENGIGEIVQQRCASCHAEGKPAQQLTGLRLDGDTRTYDLLTRNAYVREDGVKINHATRPGDGLTDLDQPGTDRITRHYSCCTVSRWLAMNSARSSMLIWALYGERLDGRDPATGLPPVNSGVPVDPQGREFPEIWPKVDEHAGYVADMPEREKRLLARWVDMGAPLTNVHDDLVRPVLTVTPVLSGGYISQVLVGLWDDSPLDYSRFRVLADGIDITPAIDGQPAVIPVSLPVAVSEANADEVRISFEIWDRPDRSLSLVQPGVPAANRTRKSYTGRGLLRLAGVDVSATDLPDVMDSVDDTNADAEPEPMPEPVVDPEPDTTTDDGDGDRVDTTPDDPIVDDPIEQPIDDGADQTVDDPVTEPTPEPDVDVATVVETDSPVLASGGRTQLRWTLMNLSQTPATGIDAYLRLEGELADFALTEPVAGCERQTDGLRCALDGLAAGERRGITLELTAADAGEIGVRAELLAAEPDGMLSNNLFEDRLMIEPAQVDLQLVALDAPAALEPNEPVSWTLELVNTGSDTARDVQLSAVTEAPLRVGMTADEVACTRSGDELACPVPDLAPGERLTVRVLTVSDTTPAAAVRIAVSSTGREPTPTDNQWERSYSVNAQGLDLTGLPAGVWTEIPDSRLADAVAGDESEAYLRALTEASSGAAFDSRRGRLLVWGGGGNRYGGNAVYAFDTRRLQWQQVSARSQWQEGDPESGYYRDGLPWARSTYDSLEYVPGEDALCAFGGKALYQATRTTLQNLDCLRLETGEWFRLEDVPARISYGVMTAWDPVSEKVWMHSAGGRGHLLSFDAAARQWSSHGDRSSDPWVSRMTGAIDPKRRLFVAVGGDAGGEPGGIMLWDLAEGETAARRVQTTGDIAITAAKSPGLVYDSDLDRLVAWMGGTDLYALDLDSLVWQRIEAGVAAGAAGPGEAPSAGTFGRFRYVPDQRAYVLVNAVDENVHLIRLAD